MLSKTLKNRIHKIILLVVLYGCDKWSLTLMGEHKAQEFVYSALRKILETKAQFTISREDDHLHLDIYEAAIFWA